MNHAEPNQPAATPITQAPEELFHYWLATCQVTFQDGKKIVTEAVNVLLNSVSPGLTQEVLIDVQKTAVRMLMADRKVPNLPVQNIVIMNLTFIGHMTKATFTGRSQMSQESPQEEQED